MHKKGELPVFFNKYKDAYLFIAPQMILFAIFMIYPIMEGARLSLYDISLFGSEWVGFQNYIDLFGDKVFLSSVYNTLLIVFFVTVLSVGSGFFISSAIYDKSNKYISVIRGCYYLPIIISMMVLSVIWMWLLNPAMGLINFFFTQLGFGKIDFLGNKNSVLPVIIFIVWLSTMGQSILLYVASMIGIDKSLREAAEIDGASKWMFVYHVVYPIVKPMTMYLVVLNIINVIKVFVVIHLMTGGGPNYASSTIMYLCYTEAFKFSNIGKGSAIGMVMFAIVLALSLMQFKIFKYEV